MEHYIPNSQPLRTIENVTPSNEAISPEKSLLYDRYMKKAKEAAEAGKPKESLELLKKAAVIQKTDEVLKRIEEVEATLAENADSEEEENDLVDVGDGFYLTNEIYHKMYSHQRESLLWFWRLHCEGKGGILGDDMGLGKTIQVVAFLTGLLDMQRARSVLIVLPVAVIINWESEFEKWAPGINLQCFHGDSKRDREKALMKVQVQGGVLLTSYGLVRTSYEQMIQSDGKEFNWDYIILDEGHKIKNPGKTTNAVHCILATHRFILTGTPIQNNLKEFWALFDFVTHGSILGTMKTFMTEYGKPITRAREGDATANEKLHGNEMAESMRKLIEPHILRRTKADVPEGSNLDENKTVQEIPLLTRKNDFIIWLYLTKTQIQMYKDFSQLHQVKELLSKTTSPLAKLTVLKKLCDHPRLLSARACQQLGLETTETIEEVSEGEEGSSAVTDSRTTGCNIKDIDDNILIAESGKIQFLLELLHNLTSEGHRTLIFSQSRKMLDILEKILQNQKFKYMRLDGTVSKLSDREQRIKCFKKDTTYSFFLITTQVGAVGLNLTEADRVVIVDPSWNPSNDNQAVDRAYRIGQTKDVVIYRLITCGTVEEKIYRRQVFKDSLTKQVTGASKNPWSYSSKEELGNLFILDDPSRSKTQEQLQEMHSADRKSDTDLDTHIAFLDSLDSMYGISDHDLMFSEEAAIDENTGFETEDYVQERVKEAEDSVSAESDLTAQLKEMNLKTKAPGLHLQPTDVESQGLMNRILAEKLEDDRKKSVTGGGRGGRGGFGDRGRGGGFGDQGRGRSGFGGRGGFRGRGQGGGVRGGNLEKSCDDRSQELNNQERFSRRNNIRVVGLKSMENEDCIKMAQEVIAKIIGIQGCKLEGAHRTGIHVEGRDRHLLVQFTNYQDKESVMKYARRALQHKEYYIVDDLTEMDLKEKKRWSKQVKDLYDQGTKLRFYEGRWRQSDGEPYKFTQK